MQQYAQGRLALQSECLVLKVYVITTVIIETDNSVPRNKNTTYHYQPNVCCHTNTYAIWRITTIDNFYSKFYLKLTTPQQYYYLSIYLSFGQGSSLLWIHMLRPFYSRPLR